LALAKSKSREAVFQSEFLGDMEFWIKTDRKTALRILRIVDEILRDPFTGIGKPEPLKDFGPDAWSRRVTQEHRLVYLVGDDRIDFLQARHHY
jgi:toxin YoeB